MNSLTSNKQQKTRVCLLFLQVLTLFSCNFYICISHSPFALPLHIYARFIYVTTPPAAMPWGILLSTRNMMTQILGPLSMSQGEVREEGFAREKGEMGQNQMVVCFLSSSSYMCPHKRSVIKFYTSSTLM